MGIIYCATNLINGKKYIGMTTRTLEERQITHRHTLKKGYKCYFYNAIRVYGWEGFLWEILDRIDTREELVEKERYWIKFYDTTNREKGYNMTHGGDGLNCTEEVRQKLIDSHKGKKMNSETIKKRTESRRLNGWNKNPEETRKRKSDAAKGKYLSGESFEKRTETRRQNRNGKPMYNARKVLCIETGEIFSSIAEAEQKYKGHIGACCRQERKTANSYHWQFAK